MYVLRSRGFSCSPRLGGIRIWSTSITFLTGGWTIPVSLMLLRRAGLTSR
jgi:hypothetical protein